ncbi:MAG: succinate dehydrogenase/fumarate reductase iron-sulfur subunit [Cytophagales bacterium]|nr:succinate dehydrogenase/fumarate reductase iron-sulfur subunit [Cytophagales bacterium]
MKITLKIWRQSNSSEKGNFQTYSLEDISPDSSFLEVLDLLNVRLEEEGKDPIHFDHDCREGICGTCSLYINGRPHGPSQTTTCQLHMRSFKDGELLWVEPWRAKPFPVIKDLVVDRNSLDRIIQAGGYVSVRTGGVPDANSLPVGQDLAEESMDAASCIGCGACVASCKNASAMLFVAAKVSHLALLPQGKVERQSRVQEMIAQMDKEGFGSCTNTAACEAECPKNISVSHIARLNREFFLAKILPETK